MSPEKRSVQNIIKCTYCDDATIETDVLIFDFIEVVLRSSHENIYSYSSSCHIPRKRNKRTKNKRSKKTPFVTNELDKTKRAVEINIARKQRLCHDMITR